MIPIFGTFRKPKRFVDRIFLHCSATDNPDHDDVEVIRDWHMNGNGWSDIGYHFFIDNRGFIHVGRPLYRQPAAQARNNKGTIAICVSGLKVFSDAQTINLCFLCRDIDRAYNGSVTFHGHCEVSSKTCPNFDYREVLNLTDKGYMR